MKLTILLILIKLNFMNRVHHGIMIRNMRSIIQDILKVIEQLLPYSVEVLRLDNALPAFRDENKFFG